MGCDCIGQVSLLNMPGYDGGVDEQADRGTYDETSDSHFACDARGINGGQLCPEFTLLEANMYGYRTTPRVCPGLDVWGYWDACDGEGDLAMDVNEESSQFTYGPGGDIDTKSAVDVTVEFLCDDDASCSNLTGYTVTLTQGDKTYTVEKSGDYVSKLTPMIKAGMVI